MGRGRMGDYGLGVRVGREVEVRVKMGHGVGEGEGRGKTGQREAHLAYYQSTRHGLTTYGPRVWVNPCSW